jgi:hypothetical protein
MDFTPKTPGGKKKLEEASQLMDVVTPYLMPKRASSGGGAAMSVGLNNMQPRQANGAAGGAAPARHSNSTSTIYASSTISSPNDSEVIQSVASVLHCIMLQNAIPTGGMAPDIDPRIAMFDERSYTKKETRKRLRWGFNLTTAEDEKDASKRAFPDEGVPPVTEIYYFLMACSQRAQFASECSIIALVLLNRLLTTPMTFTIGLHAFNWRLFFLTSLMIAQKIWEDISLANIDFPIIWRHAVKVEDDQLDVKAFNVMEARFLELLSFNVFVSASLYGQFCFELRSIHCANSKAPFPITPLTPDQAARLEASTAVNPDVLRAHVKGGSKSATSSVRGKVGQFVLS